MNGMTYVVFHNAADDSYMNSTHNFRGADVTGNTEITLYFASAIKDLSHDSVKINITAGTEVATIELLAAAFAGAKNPVTIIADDINSNYIADGITSCGDISVLTGKFRRVESITPGGDGTGAAADANTRVLTAADSGKTFLINIASNTAAFRLPDPVVGLEYKFILDISSDAEGTKDLIVSTNNNAVNILGTTLDAGGVNDQGVGASVLQLDTSDGVASAGDRFGLVCDGTHYYAEDGIALTTGAFNIIANAI